MIKGKNGEKVTVASMASLDNLEDFPERDVPPGVTDEDLMREEFDSEEEYQAYLAQQVDGWDLTNNKMNHSTATKENKMVTNKGLENLARAATLETGLEWAGTYSSVANQAALLRSSWGLSDALLVQGFRSIHVNSSGSSRLSMRALKIGVCSVIARGLYTAQRLWCGADCKSVDLGLGSCLLLMGLREELQSELMGHENIADVGLGMVVTYMQNQDKVKLTEALFNLLEDRALMGHKPAHSDEGDTEVHMHRSRKELVKVQLNAPYEYTPVYLDLEDAPTLNANLR